jgi:heme O synthase-like polyprenyltransferase
MTLLLLTGFCAMLAGARGLPAWPQAAGGMLGLALACGGASALNHVLDADIDRLMGRRTRGRPVAAAGGERALVRSRTHRRCVRGSLCCRQLAALALGLPFVALALSLCQRTTAARAATLFRYSLLYLALLFGAAALDQVLA